MTGGRGRRSGGRGGSEERLGALVDPALLHLGVRRGVREIQLRAAVSDVVGPQLAPLCEAVSLERGTLLIATTHTALAHQLSLDSPTVIAALNERIGAGSVHRLRFRALG